MSRRHARAIVWLLLTAAYFSEVTADVDLSVERIEITQGIQDTANSIAGVDGRVTTVRAYLGVGGDTIPGNVNGRLDVFHDGVLIHSLMADNGPIVATVLPDREQENDTLNFTFLPLDDATPHVLGRSLDFLVTVDPLDAIVETDEGNNILMRTHLMECLRAPRIEGVPLSYSFAGADPDDLGSPDTALISAGVADAMLLGMFPWPEQSLSGDPLYSLLGGGLGVTDDINLPATLTDLFIRLDTLRVARGTVPDYLYGWFRGNPFSGNGAAWASMQVGFGNTDPTRHQRTFAHEIGHLIGFDHQNVLLGDTGWDTLERLARGPVQSSTLRDIMWPARLTAEAWIATGTFREAQAEATRCFDVTPVVPLPVRHVLGRLAASGWLLAPSFKLEAIVAPPTPSLDGDGEVRITDVDGTVLYSTRVSIVAAPDAVGEGGSVAFSALVPSLPGEHGIEFWLDGQLRHSLSKTPSAPSIAILSPQPGATLTPNSVIEWAVSDAEPAPLRALVRYSQDGETWFPLRVRTGQTSFELDAGGLPSGLDGRLQFLVTDGFNTSMVEVGQLRTSWPNRPPIPWIHSPRNGQEFRHQANIVLSGGGEDPEDGVLPRSSMTWWSDVEGLLGVGGGLNLQELLPGWHTIELRVEDSQLGSASQFVTIRVIPDPRQMPGPGETSPPQNPADQLRVGAYDRQTGRIVVEYAPAACDALEHNIYWGDLAQVGSYAYQGVECNVGNDGSAAFHPGSGSVFFLIVANNGMKEGSYGLDSSGLERPEWLSAPQCEVPQEINQSCE